MGKGLGRTRREDAWTGTRTATVDGSLATRTLRWVRGLIESGPVAPSQTEAAQGLAAAQAGREREEVVQQIASMRPALERLLASLDMATVVRGQPCWYCQRAGGHAPDCPVEAARSLASPTDPASAERDQLYAALRRSAGANDAGHMFQPFIGYECAHCHRLAKAQIPSEVEPTVHEPGCPVLLAKKLLAARGSAEAVEREARRNVLWVLTQPADAAYEYHWSPETRHGVFRCYYCGTPLESRPGSRDGLSEPHRSDCPITVAREILGRSDADSGRDELTRALAALVEGRGPRKINYAADGGYKCSHCRAPLGSHEPDCPLIRGRRLLEAADPSTGEFAALRDTLTCLVGKPDAGHDSVAFLDRHACAYCNREAATYPTEDNGVHARLNSEAPHRPGCPITVGRRLLGQRDTLGVERDALEMALHLLTDHPDACLASQGLGRVCLCCGTMWDHVESCPLDAARKVTPETWKPWG